MEAQPFDDGIEILQLIQGDAIAMKMILTWRKVWDAPERSRMRQWADLTCLPVAELKDRYRMLTESGIIRPDGTVHPFAMTIIRVEFLQSLPASVREAVQR